MRLSLKLRAIVDELERSNLIIHVEPMGIDSSRQFSGTMRFVDAAGGRRFLRITIDERLSADQRAAALGHELQHALEVARSGSVVDQASFADLYRRIGNESGPYCDAVCYETDDAQRVGAIVLADVRTAASTAGRTIRVAGAAHRNR